jgi:hypothetical protein
VSPARAQTSPDSRTRLPRSGQARRGNDVPVAVILVRLLLFLALAAIGVAGVLYLYSRNRRYLRFIGQVIKFTLILLVVVMLFFAFERLVGPLL